MSKIGFKVFIIILLISLSGLVFTSIYINYNVKSNFRDYLYQERRGKILSLIEMLEDQIASGEDNPAFRNMIVDFIRVNQLALRVEDLSGQVIFDIQQGMMGNGMMRGRMRGLYDNISLSNTETFSIEHQGKNIARLIWFKSRLERLPVEGQYFTKRLNRVILLAGLLVAIVTIIISLFLSRYLSSPLLEMNRMAGKVARGELHHRLTVNGNDELADLASSFNTMVVKLEHLERIRKESTSDLAHELRTPLTTIRSYLEGIEEGVLTANDETFTEIEEELERLVRLVNRLGELAEAERKQVYQSEKPENIAEILKKIVNRFYPLTVDKGINLILEFPEDVSLVSGDRDSLETIFTNLLSNAIKYTPPSGKVEVIIAEREREVEISISDSGIGIAAGDLPFIFERFYRADKSRASSTGGTGIGLTITRELVLALDGQIQVESQGKDQGTTFTITFPKI